ncbi:MAG TPA: hypothetical protein VG964_03120 [Candidatus Saccharimonadales bacterium]|nr:hypothetical protein [Candidatus Saccharimonadales bacterium]
MSKQVPEFRIFGQDSPTVLSQIQPELSLRDWNKLTGDEKKIALQELANSGWVEQSKEVLVTIARLNNDFLRELPGEELHAIKPRAGGPYTQGNESQRKLAALHDFSRIFLEKDEVLAYRMISELASQYIDGWALERAKKSEDDEEKAAEIADAFSKFDRLANCLNHIFKQFGVNIMMTRSGLVPVQDERISKDIFAPTLVILSDPKWQAVNKDLQKMFDEFLKKNYSEAITKGHSAIQRFLQILNGKGKNGKGELAALFKEALGSGLIPADRFSEPILRSLQGYFASERATNSTAKPAAKDATFSDALLFMNITMVFIQHVLQKEA